MKLLKTYKNVFNIYGYKPHIFRRMLVTSIASTGQAQVSGYGLSTYVKKALFRLRSFRLIIEAYISIII